MSKKAAVYFADGVGLLPSPGAAGCDYPSAPPSSRAPSSAATAYLSIPRFGVTNKWGLEVGRVQEPRALLAERSDSSLFLKIGVAVSALPCIWDKLLGNWMWGIGSFLNSLHSRFGTVGHSLVLSYLSMSTSMPSQ